jgi:hypothetical protein
MGIWKTEQLFDAGGVAVGKKVWQEPAFWLNGGKAFQPIKRNSPKSISKNLQ